MSMKKYYYVDTHTAHLTEMHGQVPTIPEDIGGRDEPILGLNATEMECFRQHGVWHCRNPNSAWLPSTWLRGSPVFQIQLTMSYASESS